MKTLIPYANVVALFLVVLLFAFGCPSPPEPKPPRPIPIDGATCAMACENMAELGCELGAPTNEGTECVEVCENTDGPVSWDVGCLTAATGCEVCDDD